MGPRVGMIARLAPLLAVLPLAACGTVLATQDCARGICTIVLSGDGAKVQVDGTSGHTLELVDTGDRTARLKVDGSEGDVTRGVPVGFGNNATLTLTKIDGGEVTVIVDTTTAPEDAAVGNR